MLVPATHQNPLICDPSFFENVATLGLISFEPWALILTDT